MSEPFVFIGENLALDFVNTEVIVRNKPRDLLASSADLRHWQIAAQGYHSELTRVSLGDSDFNQVLILRGVIRRILTAVIRADIPSSVDIEPFNQILAMGHLHIEPIGIGRFQQRYVGDQSGLLMLATATVTLLTQYDLSRLHQCKNERCILIFYDTTKNGTRRWCTPDCQNRARSIEHYQKRRGAD